MNMTRNTTIQNCLVHVLLGYRSSRLHFTALQIIWKPLMLGPAEPQQSSLLLPILNSRLA